MDEQTWEIWKTTRYEILYVILGIGIESMQRAWVGVLMCEGCIEDRESTWVVGVLCVVRVVWGWYLLVEADRPYPSAHP